MKGLEDTEKGWSDVAQKHREWLGKEWPEDVPYSPSHRPEIALLIAILKELRK